MKKKKTLTVIEREGNGREKGSEMKRGRVLSKWTASLTSTFLEKQSRFFRI